MTDVGRSAVATAETITDAQIRELYIDHSASLIICSYALSIYSGIRCRYETSKAFEVRKSSHYAARVCCAEIWNARHGGGSR